MTLSEAEQLCATGDAAWRGQVAGCLHRVRARLAEGHAFAPACSMTMAEPLRAEKMAAAVARGCPIPADLSSLTGP